MLIGPDEWPLIGSINIEGLIRHILQFKDACRLPGLSIKGALEIRLCLDCSTLVAFEALLQVEGFLCIIYSRLSTFAKPSRARGWAVTLGHGKTRMAGPTVESPPVRLWLSNIINEPWI